MYLLECVTVRFRVILIVLLLAVLGSAETIRLKNGRKILADRVRENNGRIEYEIGDSTFAIPKATVESIEAGGAPQALSSIADMPAYTPRDDFGTLNFSLMRDGHVDPEALASLDRSGNASLAAMGYFTAARHEYEHGNREQARAYLERARAHMPDNAIILTHLAALLLQLGRAADALAYAEQASRVAPNSSEAQAVLGFAYFASDKSREAVRAWKRALQLRPDPVVEAALGKAERELTAEATFSQRESGHFTLRYEGSRTPESLGRSVLAALESDFDDLTRELGVSPHASIPVILYTDQAFFDVTQAPGWTGAINDGKLRLPVEGVTLVTPELARVLRHELAHSFINYASRLRCPVWLNEGIAQLLEPRSVSSYGHPLARLFAVHKQIHFNLLESSFMRFSTAEAAIAYAESLAAAEYIRDTYGVTDLQRILTRIGEGASTESALRTTIHSGYAGLEEDIARYLKDRYGVD